MVLSGVPQMIEEINIQTTFPDGVKVPNESDSGSHPGEIFLKDNQPIIINGDRDSIFITVRNESSKLISIGSHFHLVEANRHLAFDRTLAYRMRRNIPAGDILTFNPGEQKEAPIISISGQRFIHGGNGLFDGPVNDENLENK